MSKLVLPPPQQAFVSSAGRVTEPWRVYLDELTHGLNNARQLISAGQITAGTTEFEAVIPSEWRSAEIVYTGIRNATTPSALTAAFSTDSGATYISTYRYAFQVVVDTTAVGEVGSTGNTVLLMATNLSSASTAELSGQLSIPELHTTRAHAMFESVHMTADTTPRLAATRGGGMASNNGPVTAVRIALGPGSFSTGKYAVYGER